MSKFIAGARIRAGQCVSMTGPAFVRDGELVAHVTPTTGREWGGIVGVAARNIAKGELIHYQPDGNTNDIATKADFAIVTDSMRKFGLP
jgi:hypothetical protein